MAPERAAIIARKRAMLEQFITDLRTYESLTMGERRREHYAIERLLQLLCEASADIGLQLLRAKGYRLAGSYQEVFAALRDEVDLPDELAADLMDACGMRNVLTHLYDTIDLDRVAAAVDSAIALYPRFTAWCREVGGIDD